MILGKNVRQTLSVLPLMVASACQSNAPASPETESSIRLSSGRVYIDSTSLQEQLPSPESLRSVDQFWVWMGHGERETPPRSFDERSLELRKYVEQFGFYAPDVWIRPPGGLDLAGNLGLCMRSPTDLGWSDLTASDGGVWLPEDVAGRLWEVGIEGEWAVGNQSFLYLEKELAEQASVVLRSRSLK